MTTIVIVSANGLIWPYIVIWASSQAKKESLSFLRTIRDIFSTGRFVSFKTRKINDLLKFQHSVLDWKRTERNGRSEQNNAESAQRSKADSISVSIIQLKEHNQDDENGKAIMGNEENDSPNPSSSFDRKTNVRNNINSMNYLSTRSFAFSEIDTDQASTLTKNNVEQLISLNSLINDHESILELPLLRRDRDLFSSETRSDTAKAHISPQTKSGFNDTNKKVGIENRISNLANNAWTENDMVNPQRNTTKTYSMDDSKTVLSKNSASLDTKCKIKNDSKVVNLRSSVMPSTQLMNYEFCCLNVPTSIDITSKNPTHPLSHQQFKRRKNYSSNSQGTRKDDTVMSLKSIINAHDHPTRNNVNSIMDPIRKCDNISSIHLGDYGDN